MKRSLAGLALVTVGLAVLAGSVSASGTRQARATCGVRSLTFFFWPNGHNAVPSINFPAFPYPHMEVYKSGAAYPDAAEVAAIGFGSTGQPYSGLASSCKTVKAKPINSKPVRAKTDQPTALRCTFPAAAHFELGKTASAPTTAFLRALLGPKKKRTAPLEVSVSMTDQPNGSVLRYDAKYCKAFPPPT